MGRRRAHQRAALQPGEATLSLTSLDAATRQALTEYMTDIARLRNEAAKSHRFVALLQALFGSSPVARIVPGIEKVVRIDSSAGLKRRRIDAYYGNAVIEFENSLKRTLATAQKQLREQCAGIWNDEGQPFRPLLAIATDGLVWLPFVPRVTKRSGGALRADDVELTPLAGIEVEERSLRYFWLWLTSWLFRPASVTPSADQFQFDFGARSPVYADAMVAMSEAWNAVGAQKHSKLSIETWIKYLTVTYGAISQGGKGKKTISPQLVALFHKHTYLASVARLLVWAALSGGKGTGSGAGQVDQVLSGEAFERLGIRNLVEDDFFQWVRHPAAAAALAPLWEGLLAQLRTYDLSRLDQDVLKGVYQELVDPQDRHDLGEYYTPEWLCERVVAEVLPETGFHSVLDPTCGSGSFLRAAIAHMLGAEADADPKVALEQILNGVVGIDIHPLAVTIARATYALAVRSLVAHAKHAIQIPVYLADSLFLPAEVVQHRFGETGGYSIRFGANREVTVPVSLIQNAELFDAAIAASAKVAADHARELGESRASLAKYALRLMPSLANHPERDDILDAMWRFTEQLAELIRAEEDSIWAFIVRNSYRPALLRGAFDFILGNPPWLSYRYIADPEYQEEVRRRALKQYKIAPPTRHLFTQMELATVFLVHALSTFGRADARLAFVMPRSVLTADQHTNLRQRSYTAPVRIDSYWDLFDVQPVFRVPSCVLFASRFRGLLRAATYEMPAVEWEGRLPERNLSWAEAEPLLNQTAATAKLVRMGTRNAISTGAIEESGQVQSRYAKLFAQGATIVPRNCYFVAVSDRQEPIDPDREYWCETDPEQARTAKAPWRSIVMRGRVEGRFVYSTAIARHVLPFIVLPPADVVLPAVAEGRKLRLVTPGEMRKSGWREAATWFDEVERLWKQKRGSKDGMTFLERLDYSHGLTTQSIAAPFRVVYNSAGTDVSAARVPAAGRFERFVVESTLYHTACASAGEADYLVGVLNSSVVNEAIKPFQSRGLMGPRHVHKKVLELPIPLFDGKNDLHADLAEASSKAAAAAGHAVAKGLPKPLAARRAAVRAAASAPLKLIDDLTTRLLGL